jgi:thiamine-phosphate pyrophosphorylase
MTRPVLPYTVIAEKCVANKVKMLQLREKHLPDKELLRIARDIRRITRGTGTRLVINDRPDIAVLCDADYLHLGQDDISIEDARKIVGDMKIGLSTHSIQQAKKALAERPDYIGFGPVYPTNAKAIPDQPTGVEPLKEVLGFSNVPVVAIGGIFPENMQEILDAGAANIAMVRYFMQSEDFQERLSGINQRLRQE